MKYHKYSSYERADHIVNLICGSILLALSSLSLYLFYKHPEHKILPNMIKQLILCVLYINIGEVSYQIITCLYTHHANQLKWLLAM